jgi:TolB-like protein/Tfp pilus assembly protein PilF
MFAVCLVGLIGIWVWYFLAGDKPVDTPQPPAVINLSVVPFSNDDYFAAGLSIELSNALRQVPGLRVFTGLSDEAMAVLKGTAKKSGEHLQVSAQLLDAKTNFQLWSKTYDRDVKDIFQVQEELAKEIINVLRVQIRIDPNHQLAPRLTENLAAYDSFLHGRFSLLHNDVSKAAQYFEEASQADPRFAAAIAALANSYVKLGLWPRAAATAQKAIDIDGSIGEAHAALGAVKSNEWDWSGSDREFRRAMELNSGSPDAHTLIALAYLAPLGQLENARTESQLGADLIPMSAYSNSAAGWILLLNRDYDAAIARYRKALDLSPGNFETAWELGMAYAYSGNPQQAMEQFQKSGDARNEVAELALTGHVDLAKQKIGAVAKLSNTNAAHAYALIGDKDDAFAALDKAFAQHEPQLIWLKVDPRFENLRSDTRYGAMVKKVFGDR